MPFPAEMATALERTRIWQRSSRSIWVWILLLVICATVPYANSLWNGFVYDDTSQILQNPYIRSFRYLRQIFGTAVWSFTGVPSRYYRPVMTFGYLLCYKVFGLSPAGFHLVNIGLHAAVVCIVFFLTRRMFGNRFPAFGAAALFALHPIHTESVVWIAAVTELELALFYGLTFWLFLELSNSSGRRFGLLYCAMIGSFGLALLSKEQAFTLPFLATVYEHFYRDDRLKTGWTAKIVRYLPLWVMAAAYIPIRRLALGGLVVTSNYWGITIKEIIFSAIALAGQYLWKLLWPVNLCAFYVFEKSDSLLDPWVIAALLGGIVVLAAFYWLWKHARLVSFGLIWTVTTLAPVLNPRWMGANVFAERYLYLPSIGFCWVLAWAFQAMWRGSAERRPVWRKVLVGAFSILVVAWTTRIVTRNGDWVDNASLYTQTLAVSPNASLIRTNLASLFKEQGLYQQAEGEYRQALKSEPNCTACLNQLGALFLEQERYSEATQYFTRVLQISPGSLQAHLDQGIVFQRTGMLDAAEREFLTAESLAPKHTRVYIALASLYQQKGDSPRAEASLKRALSMNPFSVQVRIALGKLYESDHRPAEAVQQFQAALHEEPAAFEAITGLQRLKVPQN